MKTFFVFMVVAVCWLVPAPVTAQVVDTTVCEILANPQSFDGKIVRIKGKVIAGFEEFSISASDCKQTVNAIWLAYPPGTKGKAGPTALLRFQIAKNNPASSNSPNRISVTLDKNKDFKNFDILLSGAAKIDGMCLGCVKSTVNATLVGRLDGTKKTGVARDNAGKVVGVNGFGNLNGYTARLVLQSVSDVAPEEIDYAKGGTPEPVEITKSNSPYSPLPPDPDQVNRGAQAFGAPGAHNGVEVGFSGANEVPKDEDKKSSTESPDGVVFSVTFDNDRLKGPALDVALAHVGTHIADIRSTTSSIANQPFYAAEFHACQTSIMSALGLKLKALEFGGGYVIYSQSWSSADMGKNAYAGIAGYLANWVGVRYPTNP